MQVDIDFIKKVAVAAGGAIMKIYKTDFDVIYKSDQSPLTAADQTANQIIIDHLKRAYPHCAILSEESADDKSRLDNHYCFLVDPLDGTKEFINRSDQFTVNIALVYEGQPILAVVYAPALQKLYYAERGRGAYLKDFKSGRIKRLSVSDKLTKLIWIGSRSHSTAREAELISAHKEEIIDVISAGSSLKGCLVAEAKADVYYRFGLTSEWDTAAMHCIVEQAGGIFRQLDGTRMIYNRENNLNEKGFYIVNRVENIWI